MARSTHIGVALVVLLAAEVAHAQRVPVSCGDGQGIVFGAVINSSTRERIPAAVVYLWREGRRFSCSVSTGSDGTFVIRGRSPGTDTLLAEAWNFRQPVPRTVTFSSSDTVYVGLLLAPGGPLEECLERPSCSGWLNSPSDNFGAEDAFLLYALKTAMVLARKNPDRPFESYICVADDTPPDVLLELRRRHPLTTKYAECQPASVPGERPEHRLRHVHSLRPAVHLQIGPQVPDTAAERTVHVGLVRGPLWAEHYLCTFRQSAVDIWRASSCKLIGVS
jgi:hypothetical protein